MANVSAPAAAAAPVMGAGDVAGVILSLLAVIAVIVLCAWLLRRMQSLQMPGGRLRLLGGLALGQRERVVLLQVDDRQLLLGVTPQHITVLRELEPQEAADTPQDFASRLRATLGRGAAE